MSVEVAPVRFKKTPVYNRNARCKTQVAVNIGGARSSKSYSIAQLYLTRLNNETGKNFGITRKTMPALKMTTMRVFIDMLKEYGRYREEYHNKTDNYYVFNGNRLQFFSLDNPEKIKSTEFNYLWMEEANEFTYNDYMVFRTRMSGSCKKGEFNQLHLSLNPSDAAGWIPKKLLAKPSKDITVIHSTYRDNPFLPPDYVKQLEGLKNIDENYYRIYALGQWGILKGLIYPNVKDVPASQWPTSFDEVLYGVDFGFNNPTCVMFIGRKGRDLYLKELVYETGLTTAALIKRLDDIISPSDRSCVMVADSAEPDRISELCNAGYNCIPADKSQNSVKAGIDFCKSQTIYLHENSVNARTEFNSYKWREGPDGEPMDEPVKYLDHAVDAFRYPATYLRDKCGLQSPSDIVKGEQARPSEITSPYMRAVLEQGGYVGTMQDEMRDY